MKDKGPVTKRMTMINIWLSIHILLSMLPVTFINEAEKTLLRSQADKCIVSKHLPPCNMNQINAAVATVDLGFYIFIYC